MEQHEIDKLIGEIQEYLDQVANEEQQVDKPEEPKKSEEDGLEAGFFTTAEVKTNMQRYFKYSRYAAVAVEILTIALFTTAVVIPFASRTGTLMFLLGVLLFGVFAVTMLHGFRARILLLLKIESNTRRIVATKTRIAEALERIRID